VALNAVSRVGARAVVIEETRASRVRIPCSGCPRGACFCVAARLFSAERLRRDHAAIAPFAQVDPTIAGLTCACVPSGSWSRARVA